MSNFKTVERALIAVFIFALMLSWGLIERTSSAAEAIAAETKDDSGAYTGIPRERSCTWWLDESLTVSKEDKAKIKKLFESLKKQLKAEGADSVEYPWKPPAEEKEEPKDSGELTAEQKKWQEDDVFEDIEARPAVIIPSPDDLNIVNIDGVPTGTLFVGRGPFVAIRMETWRMKLAKEDDKWFIRSREIESSFGQSGGTSLHVMYLKENSLCKFKKITIDHDRLHLTFDKGRFYPLYAGTKIIGGVIFGEGKMDFSPPTKLAKDWETNQERFMLSRYIEEVANEKGVEELKNVSIDKMAFYFAPWNFDKYVKIDGLETIKLTDKGEYDDADEMIKGEVDWLAGSNLLLEVPYKGQREKKRKLGIYQLPDYDELCDLYIHTPKYEWFGYYDYPAEPARQEEVYVYANRDVLLTTDDRRKGGGVCAYNRADQRESMTRREAEYEPTEVAQMLDRRVDINIGYKEKSVDLPGQTMGAVSFFNAQTAIFAKLRGTLELEITKAGVTELPIEMRSLYTSPPNPMEVKSVVDDKGLDILRVKDTLVFPPLPLGHRLTVTAEYEGPVCARLFTSSTYTSGNTSWYPSYGFLQGSRSQIVLGVPKPYRAVAVGGLDDSWETEDRNFTLWTSDQVVRMLGFVFSDFSYKELDVPKPNGETLKFMLFYYPKMRYYLSYEDFRDFESRHRNMEDSRYYGDDNRKFWAKIRMEERTTRSPDSIVDDFDSILKFQQALYVSLPYRKIAAVQLPIWSFYGQGFPTMLTLDGNSFFSDGDRALHDYYTGQWGAEFWSHESGHQYWGHVICWGNPRDQWWSEAFTEQQCAMYMQASRGQDWYVKKLGEWREWVITTLVHHKKDAPMTLNGRFDHEAWFGLFYNKAPYWVHMIRQMLGDKAFMAYERNLVKSLYWKRATSSDFCRVLEETIGKDNMLALFGKDNMQWFFDQWIYGVGIPSYDYGYKISGNTAKIKIKHAKDDVRFRARIPIWVHPESGDNYAIPLLLTGEKPVEEFEVKLQGPAKKLVLDEFGAVLTDKIKEKKYNKVK